jgi:hypothetical protein
MIWLDLDIYHAMPPGDDGEPEGTIMLAVALSVLVWLAWSVGMVMIGVWLAGG